MPNTKDIKPEKFILTDNGKEVGEAEVWEDGKVKITF